EHCLPCSISSNIQRFGNSAADHVEQRCVIPFEVLCVAADLVLVIELEFGEDIASEKKYYGTRGVPPIEQKIELARGLNRAREHVSHLRGRIPAVVQAVN